MKNIFSKLQNSKYPLMLTIIGFLIIVFLLIIIYKQIKPKTVSEKIMNCLKLGSDARATACIKLIK